MLGTRFRAQKWVKTKHHQDFKRILHDKQTYIHKHIIQIKTTFTVWRVSLTGAQWSAWKQCFLALADLSATFLATAGDQFIAWSVHFWKYWPVWLIESICFDPASAGRWRKYRVCEQCLSSHMTTLVGCSLHMLFQCCKCQWDLLHKVLPREQFISSLVHFCAFASSVIKKVWQTTW